MKFSYRFCFERCLFGKGYTSMQVQSSKAGFCWSLMLTDTILCKQYGEVKLCSTTSMTSKHVALYFAAIWCGLLAYLAHETVSPHCSV